MFAQVFQAPVGDRDHVRAAFQRWADDHAGEADGFLDGISGVTDDGRLVSAVRFASQQQAQANSDRPGQSAWWQDLSSAFTGEASFDESTDVRTVLDGPGPGARFAQVIRGRATDRARVEQMLKDDEAWLRRERPEVLGGFVAWHDGDRFIMVVTFRDEASAREGEPKNAESPAADLDQSMEDVTFEDLRDPWIMTA